MQSKRWSSITAWLAIMALASASVGSAQLHHNEIHNPHLNVQRGPAPVEQILAREPAPTSPPVINSRNHAASHQQRDLEPTPVFKQFERRRTNLHKRLIPIGGGDAAASSSSSAAAAQSSADASSSLEASISSSIQASITSSIQASITSSIQASITASMSRASDIAASKASVSAASALSASIAAAQSSLLASISSSILNNPVTSTSFVTNTPTISADTSSNTGSGGDGHTSLIIGVSVVGGAALLGLIAFLWMKFGNKRSGYDEDDHDIRWPELRSEGDSAAMHPLPARRTGGAGFEMGGESDLGHDRDMVEHDGGYGRNSFSGSTTALGAGGAGYGAYGTGNAAYHDSVVDTNSVPGYTSQAGYYDQYGHEAAGNPYADSHAASAGYGNAPMNSQGYYDHSPAAVADPHAAGGYGQDVYQQHSNVSPPMHATHAGYGGQHI